MGFGVRRPEPQFPHLSGGNNNPHPGESRSEESFTTQGPSRTHCKDPWLVAP